MVRCHEEVVMAKKTKSEKRVLKKTAKAVYRSSTPIWIPKKATLAEILIRSGVPIHKWSTRKGHKTIHHLWSEVCARESRLYIDRVFGHKRLLRRASKVYAKVFHWHDGELLLLREAKQVFKDGGCRCRSKWKRPSFAEKLKSGEYSCKGLVRGMSEELGISGGYTAIPTGVELKDKESKSYPGLQSLSKIYHYRVYLSEKEWKPKGYVERQKDKTTFFRWKKVPMSYRFLKMYIGARLDREKRSKPITKKLATLFGRILRRSANSC